MSFGSFRFGFGRHSNLFEEQYRCFPISFSTTAANSSATSEASEPNIREQGDKIILPGSAFEKLANMEVTYPLQFEVRNEYVSPPKITHVGVLEFTAQEGRCYIPNWIIQNLQLFPDIVAGGSSSTPAAGNASSTSGSCGIITVRNISLPLASFVKFKPKSADFLDISNPKAVLESTLRRFSCLTKHDEICLFYNKKNYYLEVRDLEPQDACSIVEADVKVDFEAPDGFKQDSPFHPSTEQSDSAATPAAEDQVDDEEKEEQKKSRNMELLEKANAKREEELSHSSAAYIAFSGKGNRVDGKVRKARNDNSNSSSTISTLGSSSSAISSVNPREAAASSQAQQSDQTTQASSQSPSVAELRRNRIARFSKRAGDLRKFTGSGRSLN